MFTLLRSNTSKQDNILCLVNVSPQPQSIQISLDEIGLMDTGAFTDLINGQAVSPISGILELELIGYQTMWLLAENQNP